VGDFTHTAQACHRPQGGLPQGLLRREKTWVAGCRSPPPWAISRIPPRHAIAHRVGSHKGSCEDKRPEWLFVGAHPRGRFHAYRLGLPSPQGGSHKGSCEETRPEWLFVGAHPRGRFHAYRLCLPSPQGGSHKGSYKKGCSMNRVNDFKGPDQWVKQRGLAAPHRPRAWPRTAARSPRLFLRP
jgi:hypothetical protein